MTLPSTIHLINKIVQNKLRVGKRISFTELAKQSSMGPTLEACFLLVEDITTPSKDLG